jgi:hypothetical protein
MVALTKDGDPAAVLRMKMDGRPGAEGLRASMRDDLAIGAERAR